MLVVAATGVLSALLRDSRELLPVTVLVVIPLAGLVGLWTKVPPHRPSWRYGILAVMLGLVIRGMGWLWAGSVIWYFQRQEGFVAIGGASRGGRLRILGVDDPRPRDGHQLDRVPHLPGCCLHTAAPSSSLAGASSLSISARFLGPTIPRRFRVVGASIISSFSLPRPSSYLSTRDSSSSRDCSAVTAGLSDAVKSKAPQEWRCKRINVRRLSGIGAAALGRPSW